VFDYHVHSDCSFDSFESMDATCLAAIRAGVAELAFTEHVDFEPADESTGYYDHHRYIDNLGRVRTAYGDRLMILSGAEVDFNTNRAAETRAFLDQHRFDLVIGSVHFFLPLGGGAAEMVYPEIWDGRTTDDVYAGYLDQIRAAAATGWFDTIGHMDFPKRYAPKGLDDYDPFRYREQWQAVFAELIRTDTAFEINTSGLRKSPGAGLPGPAVVRWYAEAGGTRITTGSDTHEAGTIGSGIRTTLAMLRLCGITDVLSFRERGGVPVPIDELLGIQKGGNLAPA
jgi:histidinol-phosphatase (PHP family)